MPLVQTRKPSVAEKSLLSQVLGLGFAIGTKATKATQSRRKRTMRKRKRNTRKNKKKKSKKKRNKKKKRNNNKKKNGWGYILDSARIPLKISSSQATAYFRPGLNFRDQQSGSRKLWWDRSSLPQRYPNAPILVLLGCSRHQLVS